MNKYAIAATAHANAADYERRVAHTINQNRNRNQSSSSSSANTASGHPEVVDTQLIEYAAHEPR